MRDDVPVRCRPQDTQADERRYATVEDAVHGGRDVVTRSSTPRLDAEVLLAHVLGRSRPWVLAHGEAPLSDAEEASFRALIARRSAGEPVAYLRGFTEWYGMTFDVTPDVLIPRPETELVLERAVTLAGEIGARTVVDVGTGSGALAIGLALHSSATDIVAVDVSAAALAVARRNAARHGVEERIRFLRGHLLEPVERPPDLVVANLPYLSDEMMEDISPDVGFEPRLALHGGTTGLELYSEMLRQIEARGWSPFVVLEIDPRQADPIRDVWAERRPEIEADYAGRERIVVLRGHA